MYGSKQQTKSFYPGGIPGTEARLIQKDKVKHFMSLMDDLTVFFGTKKEAEKRIDILDMAVWKMENEKYLNLKDAKKILTAHTKFCKGVSPKPKEMEHAQKKN